MNKKRVKLSALITNNNVQNMSTININIEHNNEEDHQILNNNRKRIYKRTLNYFWLSPNQNSIRCNLKELSKIYRRHKKHIEQYKLVETCEAMDRIKKYKNTRDSSQSVCLRLHRKMKLLLSILKKIIHMHRSRLNTLYRIYKGLHATLFEEANKHS